jgi:hypothetical protein
MDASNLNARMYAGRGRAAKHIGFQYRLYRPVDAFNPLANLVGQLPVAFNAGDGKYTGADPYDKPLWYADFDAAEAQEGDYLVSVGATINNPFAHPEVDPEYFFIAARQSLLPVIAMACDRFIRITRPAAPAAPAGVVGYSGIAPDGGGYADVLGSAAPTNGGQDLGWPCSILLGGRASAMKEPLAAGAAAQSGWMIYLPPSVPVALLAGDRVLDDIGRAFVVDGAELTSLGYRLQTTEAHA